ncbi:hypothetical protein RYX36_008335 [Vicia faba]
MKTLTVNTDDSFSSLLEFASNNDFEEFKVAIASNVSLINEVGFWYARQKGSKQIVLEHKTPLMVAASYGSIDILKLVLSCPEADENFACGNDKSTALHCAASGDSVNAFEAVKLLLSAGANINCMDANGNRPVDVIVVPPKPEGVKTILEELLADSDSDSSVDGCSLPLSVNPSTFLTTIKLQRHHRTPPACLVPNLLHLQLTIIDSSKHSLYFPSLYFIAGRASSANRYCYNKTPTLNHGAFRLS